MIPKIIHYCWYGRGKKDELTERCMESWKRYCPDYQIVEWNEDNCDIESSIWAKEAYENKQWAFVADYFRLKAMFEYGGIYMDTDVEVIKNLDPFLDDEAFVSYADDTYIGSGMFGCSKGNAFCKKLLDYYENRHFTNDDGSYYDVPNNQIYTMICSKILNLKWGSNKLDYGNVRIYPSDYFAPLKKRTIGNPEKIYNHENFDCTENTYAIHYTVYSWTRNNSLKTIIKLYFNQAVRLTLPRKMYFSLKRKSKISEMENRVKL